MSATALLDPAEARAAEKKVLDRAGRLTPGGLRAAILRAVMEVAPKKAQKRREAAARDARVQRWAEDSGNAALMGRELPPDEVLAADAAGHPAGAGRAARGAFRDRAHRPESRSKYIRLLPIPGTSRPSASGSSAAPGLAAPPYPWAEMPGAQQTGWCWE